MWEPSLRPLASLESNGHMSLEARMMECDSPEEGLTNDHPFPPR